MALKDKFAALRNLVYEEDVPKATTTSAPVSPYASVGTVVTNPSPQTFTGGGGVDASLLAELRDSVAQAPACVAFREFVKLRDALNTIIPDPQQRQNAALATAKPQGYTPDRIIGAIRSGLQTLDAKTAEFEQLAQQATAERVGSKDTEITAIDGQITDKTVQIAQLQTEINALTGRRQALVNGKSAEEQKLSAARMRFTATLSQLRAELTNELSRLPTT